VLDGALGKMGIGIETVTDGGNAEIYSPFKPFSPVERAKVMDQMRKTYDLFVSRVAEGRERPVAEINAVARAASGPATARKNSGWSMNWAGSTWRFAWPRPGRSSTRTRT
jgi:ClpP class serine protease